MNNVLRLVTPEGNEPEFGDYDGGDGDILMCPSCGNETFHLVNYDGELSNVCAEKACGQELALIILEDNFCE